MKCSPKHVVLQAVWLCVIGTRFVAADETLLQQAWNDGKYMASSPARLQSTDLPWLFGSLSLIGGAMAADRSIYRQWHPQSKSGASTHLKSYSDKMQYVGPILGASFWAVGECHADTYTKETGTMMLSSLLWTFVANGGLKLAVGRKRPSDTQDDPFSFKAFRSGGSFPSGHTDTTFAAATLFAERYPVWQVIVPAYSAATAVAFARVYSNQHWTSDVIGGALLGFGISHTIVSRHNKKSGSENKVVFTGEGLMWVRRF